MGTEGKLWEDVLLTNCPRAEAHRLLRGKLEVCVADLTQHHHQDGHDGPGEVVDLQRSLPREEDDEHHHEADGYPDVGNTEYTHFLRDGPENAN